jgi:ankyrin repeat protein
MSKRRPTRIIFLLAVCLALLFIGRNLYRRYINRALVAAIKDGNVSFVRWLLEHGADPNYRFVDATQNEGAPPQPVLHLVFVKMNPQLVNVFTKPPRSGAYNPNLPDANLEQIVLLLLRHGARWQDGDYLAEACGVGDIALARDLLGRGDASSLLKNGSALTSAINYKYGYYTSDGKWVSSSQARKPEDRAEAGRRLEVSRALAHLLEEHGAHLTLEQAQEIGDVAAVNKMLAGMGPGAGAEAYAAMTRAAGRGDIKTLSQLLEKGIDPNRPPERSSQLQSGFVVYETPLHAAVTSKHVDTVRLLLAHGADPSGIKNSPNMGFEEAPLTIAARMGNLELVKLLLAHGAKINAFNPSYGSALEAALSSQHPDLVRYLLAHGASVTVRPTLPYPLLTIALRKLPELVPDLLKHGAPVNLPPAPPVLPNSAPPKGPMGMAGFGQAPSPPPDASPSDPSAKKNITSSSTPSGAAITRPGTQVAGAPASPLNAASLSMPPEFRCEWQVNSNMAPYSPLMAAVFFAPQYEAALVARGAKIGPDRSWACLCAVVQRRMDLLPKLLAYGADINGTDPTHETALSLCMERAPNAVKTLLEQGANPNVLSHNFRTLLQEAAVQGRTEQARLLLAHGANVNTRVQGHTALYWARKKNHADIVALLQQAGAQE